MRRQDFGELRSLILCLLVSDRDRIWTWLFAFQVSDFITLKFPLTFSQGHRLLWVQQRTLDIRIYLCSSRMFLWLLEDFVFLCVCVCLKACLLMSPPQTNFWRNITVSLQNCVLFSVLSGNRHAGLKNLRLMRCILWFYPDHFWVHPQISGQLLKSVIHIRSVVLFISCSSLRIA